MVKSTKVSRYNVIATLGNGRVGNVRLYSKGERDYVRAAYNSTVNNPRTEKQMAQRLTFTSRSSFFRSVKPYVGNLFEGVTPYLSAANIFQQLNPSLGVYLTKEDNRLHKNVLQDYIISDGSLGFMQSAVLNRASGDEKIGCPGFYCKGLFLGRKNMFDDNVVSTFGELCQILIDNNPIIRNGDKLSVVIFRQLTEVYMNVKTTVKTFVIDTEDDTPFSTDVADGSAGLYCVGVERQGTSPDFSYNWYLGYSLSRLMSASVGNVEDGTGIAFILSRTENGLNVSTSNIASRNTLADTLLMSDQFETARLSYGESREVKGIGDSGTVSLTYRAFNSDTMGTGDPDILPSNYLTVSGPTEAKMGDTVKVTATATSTATSAGFSLVDLVSGVDRSDIVDVTANSDGSVSLTFIASQNYIVGFGFMVD